jgi:hypothetical protein
VQDAGGLAEQSGRSSPGPDLASWKEIASYLGVSIRTAQMWERERGLPVRRLPGSHGRVIAATADLEAWRYSRLPGTAAPRNGTRRGIHFPAGRRAWAWLGVTAAVITLAVAAAVLRYPRNLPAGYRFDRNTLAVLDARGRELWRKTFPGLAAALDSRRIWIGDIEGDGQSEVLFAPVWERPGSGPGILCYSHDGREKWRFSPGRPVRSRIEQFGPNFDVQAFAVAALGPRGALRIVASSAHRLHHPAQVALLDPGGRLLREYWHSGHLTEVLITDLGRHGRNRILLGGVDRARRAATLVVLDPETMGGASVEEDADFQLQGFAPGRELARLVFPRSDINRLMEPYSRCDMLWREGNEIAVSVQQRLAQEGAAVHYDLNLDLSLSRMEVSSGFEQAHAQLFAGRMLDHALTSAEVDELRQITYLKRLE